MVIISPPQLYSCYEAWEGQVTRVAAGKDCFKTKKVLSLGRALLWRRGDH